jgi:hypothetical protein
MIFLTHDGADVMSAMTGSAASVDRDCMNR